MLDIGISKLMVIGTVALVVIGPEKLPKVARMAGSLFGRAQRYINEVKAEVSREIELDELRKMQEDARTAVLDVGNSINEHMAQARQDVNAAWHGDEEAPHMRSLADTPDNPGTPPPQQSARKLKDFRRKKLARHSALPAWYKNQQGRRSHVISAAARVAKYRPAKAGANSSTFFHQ